MPPWSKRSTQASFFLFLPLWVTFKSDFLSRLSVWMTRYSVRRLKGKEVIKRNSANLFSFLSLPDNLFIWSHFTSCRQTYFPMDRPNTSSKTHTCTCTSLPTAFKIHIGMSPCYFGVYIAKFSIHRCTCIKCTCLVPHAPLVFLLASVVIGTQRTFIQTSPSK